MVEAKGVANRQGRLTDLQGGGGADGDGPEGGGGGFHTEDSHVLVGVEAAQEGFVGRLMPVPVREGDLGGLGGSDHVVVRHDVAIRGGEEGEREGEVGKELVNNCRCSPALPSALLLSLPFVVPHEAGACSSRDLHHVHRKGIPLFHKGVDVGHAGRGFLEDPYSGRLPHGQLVRQEGSIPVADRGGHAGAWRGHRGHEGRDGRGGEWEGEGAEGAGDEHESHSDSVADGVFESTKDQPEMERSIDHVRRGGLQCTGVWRREGGG